MNIQLREYQQQAVEKIMWAQSLSGNDLCVLPTGAGKSIVIAEIARRLEKDILILQPGKEILKQNYEKLSLYVDPFSIGIYSASMNEKTIRQYTLATIQSIYKNPSLFKHFTTVIIDECHLVNPKNLDGMFTSFLHEIGNPKVIGLTATPYRLSQAYTADKNSFFGNGWRIMTTTKLINRLKERFWSRLIFNINNKELTDQEYLVPLRYKDNLLFSEDLIPTNISHSDYDLEKYSNMLSSHEIKIFQAITYAKEQAKSILVFCPSVESAEDYAKKIPHSAVISAKTPAKQRDYIIDAFKKGTIQIVFNMGVLTTGFDHPGLDCIILLRPTQSIALHYQMIGRGVRKAEGKKDCLVIDLCGNVKKLGKINTIQLEKIENKWELTSETGSWHNKELYSYSPDEKEYKKYE